MSSLSRTLALKFRIASKGCCQVRRVDYGETYTPVVKFTSVRVMLAIVAVQDLELDKMDVIAFLNGDLDKDVYMEVPAGFKTRLVRTLCASY